MKIDIPALMRAGHAKFEQERANAELDKQGNMRAGNSGIRLESGEIIGTCQRVTIARTLGIDSDVDTDRPLMFAAGEGNEDLWKAILARGCASAGLHVCGDDVFYGSWKTKSGRVVSWRSDIVVCSGEMDGSYPPRPKPELVIELKLASSVWTTKSVAFEGKPSSDHMIQAGHYSWQLGVPAQLWYTSRADFAIPGFPKVAVAPFEEGNFRCNILGHDPLERYASGKAKKVRPFYAGFELDWIADFLHYRSLSGGEWVKTAITKQRIHDYYDYADDLIRAEELGPRPSNLSVTGDKMPYDKCAYCNFSKVCDSTSDFKTWVERAKQTSGN